MEHRSSFVHLIEDAKPLTQRPENQSITRAAKALLEFAKSMGTLEVEAAWRLASNVERRIEAEAGFSPPGGWSRLSALLAGTKYLRATKRGFVIAPATFDNDLGDEKLHKELVEAMTLQLVPPATAASIFIALGIHPAWGLRLAWEVQHRDRPAASTTRPTMCEWLPAEALEPIHKGVFVFISLVIGILARLRCDQSYATQRLGDVIEDAARFARQIAEENMVDIDPEHFNPLLEGADSNRRITDVLTRDLLEGVFLPAGVVRDVGDGRFVVVADIFGDVRVDNIDHSEREGWFERFLSSEGRDWNGHCEARR